MATATPVRGSAETLRLDGIKRSPKGLRRYLTHTSFRRLVQLGFAAFIAYVTVVQVVVGEGGGTIVASPEAFCPFGGLESLWRFVTSSGKTLPHTHLSNMVLAGAFLLTALLARLAFCGWICPFGFLQELTSGFSAMLQKRVPAIRKAIRAIERSGAGLAVIDRPLRFLKYAVLAWSVTGAAYFGVMVFRDYDPWAALLTIADPSFSFGLAVLIVVLVASFFVERPWCRYACPLGAAGGLVAKLSPVYLNREESACKSCAACSVGCPMGLNVHAATRIDHLDCIGCLECIDSCPRRGALELKVGLPIVGN